MKYIKILLLLVTITLLLSFISFSKEKKVYIKARNYITESHKIFVSSYGNVQYLVIGNGEPVLVSHGITGGIDQGVGLSEKYLEDNYKMIYVSRFGYLDSDIPKEANVKMQAEVYNELLDYLNIDKAFIFGNSAGGTSSMIFANEFPDSCKGLILQSSNLPGDVAALPPKLAMNIIFSNDFVYWSSIKLIGTKMLGTFIEEEYISQLSKSELKDIKNNILLSSLPVSERTDGIIFDMFVSNPYINSDDFKSKLISVPTLIVHAIDDPSIPVEYIKNLKGNISNLEIVEVTGGHLMLGSEEKVSYNISKFVEKYK